MADFTIKEKDTEPSYADILTYSNKEVVNLEGATVTMTMRTLTNPSPVLLTGNVTITKANAGEVAYTFSESDSSVPGMYMANWLVVFRDGARMTFPTTGYLWFNVEENLVTSGTLQLVDLPEVKDYLAIPANDRVHDSKLIRYIDAVRPLIENITGPILQKTYEEWHPGGNYFVSLRRRPSSGYGTNPITILMACSEYRGPIEYPLSIVQDPAHGSIYSCMLNAREGTVVRRTSGGGVMAFPPMADSVHVVYSVGQQTVPSNVVEAALETIRINYQTTQAVGKGRMTVTDAEEVPGPSMGFFLPRRVRELLAPTRRAPSVF